MSEKIKLNNEQVVAGGIKDYSQSYQLFFYPKEEQLPDKVSLYIYLKPKDDVQAFKEFAKRSLGFTSHEQLKQFIVDMAQAYFFLREKRTKPDIPLRDFRGIMLNNLCSEIRNMAFERWENKKLMNY